MLETCITFNLPFALTVIIHAALGLASYFNAAEINNVRGPVEMKKVSVIDQSSERETLPWNLWWS